MKHPRIAAPGFLILNTWGTASRWSIDASLLALLDLHEDRDVHGHDIRELRRMAQRLQDAYRDLVRRRAEMDM